MLLGSSAIANAQDLESRVLQIKALDLANEPDIFSDEFNFVYTGNYPLTPLDFDKKEDVFWEPVDMSQAVASRNAINNRTANIRPIKVKAFGFSSATSYQADGQTKVTNTVYQDMRNVQFITACPPIGTCWRCAPNRGSSLFRQW